MRAARSVDRIPPSDHLSAEKYCQMHHIANSQAEVSFPGMPSTEREGRSTNLLDLFHECGVFAFWPE